MAQVLVVDGLQKEAITAITMLNKNRKAMDGSPDDDTDFFFDIIAGNLQEDILAACIFIKVSKVSDCIRGWPEGHLFNGYYTEV